MVIISTSATEVSIQAVSPELGVQFIWRLGGRRRRRASEAAAGAAGAAAAAGAGAWAWT